MGKVRVGTGMRQMDWGVVEAAAGYRRQAEALAGVGYKVGQGTTAWR